MVDTIREIHFFKHPQMDFEVRAGLGGAYYGSTDAGEILATIERIEDGDFESWFTAFRATGDRLRKQGDNATSDVSKGDTYLRAANYYSLANVFVDGTRDISRQLPTWQAHMDCWNAFCDRRSPRVDRVEVPLDGVDMPGWFFKAAADDMPRPTVIMTNGSDGPTAGMWGFGIAGALRRGYNAFTYDGPGQNTMLWIHDVPFRHDWEAVVTPIVDALAARPDVADDKLVLSGLSQAGFWVPRALAFEHRLAAGIADPGVMDVATSWLTEMTEEDLAMIARGERDAFDAAVTEALKQLPPSTRQTFEWRRRPYCTDSMFDVLKALEHYNLRDIAARIRCPMFIADPEDEQFWPGQSQALYDALTCPKHLAKFTRAEGANWHCEPLARALYDQRAFGLARRCPRGSLRAPSARLLCPMTQQPRSWAAHL